MSRRKAKSGRLSVFKGREARLNNAIFHILALKSPLTIYDMNKEVKTQKGLNQTCYASVNKRIRSLEGLGYINKAGIRKTKAGFEVSTYELTARAYIAILLNSTGLEELINQLDEARATTILATIIDMVYS